ncbi:gibberellin 2-beta-dioxygenase [Musa troglodytarum]|uniref:Gibberellin 2-beta-dioxygenase n=1 Tax=Musa troglodytarum TaxID=320322 RepID=A0A9E7KZ64_9LILI|nr:gibberellin 2-beta-dioxygenase [Musa troglodytarum]URE32391.1 gibberellin 2-beta-dioxygenase [Musa troglodytarum]URE32396.1 gibberellin 2-beta-dioxygenase [Musa troglodytarum]
MIDSNPPFFAAYGSLFHSRPAAGTHEAEAVEECDLPLVDLSRLSDKLQAEQCKREIVTAASVWGFFQIVNHGIPNCVLDRLREEQVRVFRQPFKKKADEKFLGSLGDSYRWGAPTATSLKQLSWLEAYHIPLSSATYPVTTSPSRYLIRCSCVTHRHGYSLLLIPHLTDKELALTEYKKIKDDFSRKIYFFYFFKKNTFRF